MSTSRLRARSSSRGARCGRFRSLRHPAIIAPQDPGGDGAPRSPGLGHRLQLFGRRPRFQVESDACRLLQRKIAGRPCIGMAEAGQQIYVGRPRADAVHGRECRVRLLGRDSPSRARRAGRARKMSAGTSGSKAAASRPQMALALAVESCCATTMAASPAKPTGRRRSGGRPALATSAAKRGSISPSARSAASRSASV